MASTYSALKIELIGTGEQDGTWGTTTNTNLGTALEQAIVGKADITMSSTTITLTLTNTNALQDARAIYLNLTGSPGGAADLVVPAIQKPYIVKNGADAVVTVKVTGQTGVAVPVGATMWLYNNGTDVTNAITNLPSGATVGGSTIRSGNIDLTSQVTGTLPVANGGTGQTSASAAFNALSPITTEGDLILGNGVNSATRLPIGNNGYVLTSNGTTAAWAASTGGVTSFSAGTTGFTPNTGTTGAVTLSGTLNVANGGTGQTSFTDGQLLIGNSTGNTLTKAALTAGAGISITNGAGSITIASTGGTSGIGSAIYLATNFGGF